MFKKMRLGTRMLVSISSVAIIAFAVTISLVTIQSRQMAMEQAYTTADNLAQYHAAEVRGRLDRAMNAARTVAQSLEGLAAQRGDLTRQSADALLRQVIQRNPDYLGVWTCWEPDALDGKDAQFANQPGHDASGRYIPYVYRNNGTIESEPLVDYDKPGDGNYYLLARNSGIEQIINPYFYEVAGQSMLITTVSVPIYRGNTVVGVAGIDLSLQDLQNHLNAIRPHDTGVVVLVAGNATYVNAPGHDALIGQDIAATLGNDAKEAVLGGRPYTTTVYSNQLNTQVYRSYVPATIGNSATPWSVLVSLPMDIFTAQVNRMTVMSIAVGVLSTLVLIGVILIISRSISRPLSRLAQTLNEGASQVASASGQVSAASQSLAEGATEQAAGLEETSSSLEEMSSMTRQNADNAQQANTLAAEARKAAQGGAESMQRMSRAIDDIQKSSDETAKIIKVIDEIAFQTNLLALNAAVEAARAGEAGKGFAVVAEEVRNLAMRSAEAAKNTANMIEESVKNSKNGVEISTEVSKALDEIVGGIAKTTDLVSEIAAASSEQAQGIDQVNTAVAQMDKVTQQNAANAEESASASEELSAQAEQMQTVVDELVSIVEGVKSHQSAHRTAARRTTGAGLSKPKLGLADHTFHRIADGKPNAKTAAPKTPVKNSLPLDDSFDDFNA